MKNQEQIVIEAHRLALELKNACATWLHTPTNRRNQTAAYELAAAADAIYSFINNNTEIMGSDTGKPAFDEFNKDHDEDFQSDMDNLWNEEDRNFRDNYE